MRIADESKSAMSRKNLDSRARASLRRLEKLCDKTEAFFAPLSGVLIRIANEPSNPAALERVERFEAKLVVVEAALHQLQERRGGAGHERRKAFKLTNFTPQPAAQPPSLHGKCPDFPLVSVLEFIVDHKKTGYLKITLADETITFGIFDGDVVHTSTTQPRRGERLGEILIDGGHLSLEEFMAFVDVAGSGNSLAGMNLVKANLVSQEVLTAALLEQTRKRFDRVFDQKECEFFFSEDSLASQTGLHLDVSDFLIETNRTTRDSRSIDASPSDTSTVAQKWKGAPTSGWEAPGQ